MARWVLTRKSVPENENPAWKGGAHLAVLPGSRFGDLIFPKALRFVKRKGSFSQWERLA